MHGILWRWLFVLGTIFWISLCLADYHQKFLQMNFKQTLKSMEIRIEPPAPPFYQIVPQQRKLQPPTPALTFWKFLSIVFSVSAIVIIKRLSTFRKKRLPGASYDDFDLIRAPYDSFITRVPPINIQNRSIYHQEFQVARLETSVGFSSGDTRPPPLTGVRIVQKKLEDLENNIATLKQRINSNSASNPTSSTSDSIKKAFNQSLTGNQSYFRPVTSNTDTCSSLSSISRRTSEMKTGTVNWKSITPSYSFDLTDFNDNEMPATTSITRDPSFHTPDKTPEKSSRKSDNSLSKEMKFNRTLFELDEDIISLKELNDSMSGKNLSYKTTVIEETPEENVTKQQSQTELKSNQNSIDGLNVSSRHSKKSRKESKYQTSLCDSNKTNSTTIPSLSNRKSHEDSNKSFSLDGTSSTKFTDSNSTTSTLTSIRKKRFLKSIKNRKKELKDLSPMSTSIAAYLTPNFPTAFSRSKHRDERRSSYAAISKKKAHILKELKANAANVYMSSSNESSDSIDKFVAKIMKPDSDGIMMRNSSDDMSVASTSISSLTASSSTFISGANPKTNSGTIRSIQSVLPLSGTTISSNCSSIGNSNNMPAGAEPLSSRESLTDKNVSKYNSKIAIHSLAMNYLQTLERQKFGTNSHENLLDTGSEFSMATKSVLEKYKTKTKDCSAAASRHNILEDKYWLLHW